MRYLHYIFLFTTFVLFKQNIACENIIKKILDTDIHSERFECGFCNVPLNNPKSSFLDMPRRLTTEEFIERAIKVHGNIKYNYDLAVYTKSHNKIKIKCIKHNIVFEQNASRHLFGAGCKICAREGTAQSRKLTTKEFIERAKNKFGDKFDYSITDYVDSNTVVSVICKEHGLIKVKPHSHLKGTFGCMKCGGKERLTTKEFIEKAEKVHGKGTYDYSLVDYKSNQRKVKIICAKCGVFEQMAGNHLRGAICLKCSQERIGKLKRRYTTEEFIEKAKKIHKGKYSYKKSIYTGIDDKVIVTCPIHSDFEVSAWSHLKGFNCNKCAMKTRHENNPTKKTHGTFIKEARKIHGDRYEYIDKYINAKQMMRILCKKHNFIFTQSTHAHISAKTGCPKCNYSKGEVAIENHIERLSLEYTPQKRFKKSNIPHHSFDFFIPSYNLLIEYQGGQHYKPVKHFGGQETFIKTKQRDNKKRDFARRNGYQLLEIPYYVKDIEKMLEDKLKEIDTLSKETEEVQLELKLAI